MKKKIVLGIIIGLAVVLILGGITELVIFKNHAPEVYAQCRTDIEMALDFNKSGEHIDISIDPIHLEDSCVRLHEELETLTTEATAEPEEEKGN